ncbi:MAG: hypothetical protein ABI699_05115 [Caldimonas sp.]
MGDLTDAQRKWLEGLGVDSAKGAAAPRASAGAAGRGAGSDEYVAPVSVKPPRPDLHPGLNPAIMESVRAQVAKEKKEAEKLTASVVAGLTNAAKAIG